MYESKLRKVSLNAAVGLGIGRLVVAVALTVSTLLAPSVATAQSKTTVKGTVVDADNAPLVGVNVMVAGVNQGTTTDLNGNYELSVPTRGASVQFSLIGYTTQTIAFKNNVNDFRYIRLVEDSQAIEDVQVVAFSKQKKESVLASISTVRPGELRQPTSNLTTALAGRVSGIISYQRSGEPGQDNASFFVRGVTTFGYGNSPLILIDGIEMSSNDLARLNPDDIESFSVMKDANATALYGARGANGVIYVKTKEGREGKTRVSLRTEFKISRPTEMIETADPVTYMKTYNEATISRDPFAVLPFSTKKIDMTQKGSDPIIYPSVDWRNLLFKESTLNQSYNLSVSGGGAKAQYYVSGQYANDNGLLKVDKRNNFNNNISIDQFVLHSNVTMNFSKTTKAVVRMHANFQNYNGPIDGGAEIYKKSIKASPVLFQPYYEPDENNLYTNHILFGNYDKNADYLNPYADLVKGYRESQESKILAQIELNQDFGFVTPGLSARLLGSINRYSYYDVTRAYTPFFYQASRTLEGKYTLQLLNENAGTDYLSYNEGGKTVNGSMYFEGLLQYDRKFDKHSVSAMLVGTIQEYKTANGGSLQNSLPKRNMGLAGRFTYNYDSRYFIEANFGYNGSERFNATHRWGFFPSIGGGYIISNEKFFPESWKKVLNMVKLKATYGLVGNDNIADTRFFYLSEVNPSDSGRGYTFGTDFTYSRPGVSISRYADNNIGWEISTKQNYGIELTVLNDINFNAEYFREYRSNILMSRASIPTTMGLQSTPQANVGEASGEGVEFSIDANKYVTPDWWVAGRMNFTYAVGRFEVYEEPDYKSAGTPWLSRKGQKLSQTWGYVAEHLFVDQAEVDNSPTQSFGTYGPGDIKYKDINDDGVINSKDQVPVGYPTSPEVIYGFGLSTGYKGFDISVFFQGSARSSFWINPQATAPFIGGKSPNALLKVWSENHWTTENQDSFALWPRMYDETRSNNLQTSTWFMRNGAFLRLKTVEVGYSLPQRWSKKIAMENLRIYVTANNLVSWSKFDLWDTEMAGNGLGYPLQRVFSMGLNINF